MDVNDFLERCGLTPFPVERWHQIMETHEEHPVVAEANRRWDAAANQGDDDSLRAMYDFVYTARVPDIGDAWSDLHTRTFMLDFERQTLPLLAQFCAGASRILEGGCGCGLALTYVAMTTPHARVTGIDTLMSALTRTLERVRELGCQGVSLVHCDMLDAPHFFCASSFDRILLRNVFGNEPELASAPGLRFEQTVERLKAARAVLADAGTMWFSVSPLDDCLDDVRGHLCDAFVLSKLQRVDEQEVRFRKGSESCAHLVWVLSK